jgi:NRAMP (natural resistance-associated macrophage protein)-like metal ion transporter
MSRQPKPDIIRTVIEAPAVGLDRTLRAGKHAVQNLQRRKEAKRARLYWKILGPGLVTGAAGQDPSGIATFSQTGARYGYHFLWLAAWLYPLDANIEEMCARIGLATGRGLAANIRAHFSRPVLFICAFLIFASNAINIGADLGAMAKGVQLLAPGINFAGLVIGFAILSLGFQIFVPYAQYSRYLKWLALVLLSYIVSAVLAHLDWNAVLHAAFIPHIGFSKDELIIICAVMGTTISPYLFFWQTSQEVEEQVLKGELTFYSRQAATTKKVIRYMRIDVWSGMLLSEAVMFFIIAACGGILFPHGITNITTTAQAAEALRPFAGDAAYLLFSVGIIGSGLLAIPVLAGSSSYAVAESFHWREGLYRKLGKATGFYGTIIISVMIGLGINFLGIDPIKALIYAAVINGLVAPVVMVLILLISTNRKIMGRWVNGKLATIVGWATTAAMAVAGAAAIYALFG